MPRTETRFLSPLEWALMTYGTKVKHPGQERVHAMLRRTFGVAPDGTYNVVRGKYRWRLTPKDVAHRDMFWFGEYDSWDFLHFTSLAKSGSTVIDMGANFGYYAIMTADALDRNCTVHAFEPFPSTYELLRHHVETNNLHGIVIPHAVAMSDTVGEAPMFAWSGADLHSGASTLSGATDSKGAKLSVGATVPVTSLDAFCEAQRITDLSALKIDVEGLEERVLCGGVNTIRRFRPNIMIELHTRMLSRAGTTPARIVEKLRDYGYSLHRAERARLIPFTDSDIPPDGSYMNLFCRPSVATLVMQ